MSKSNKLVDVYRSTNEMEAMVVKSMLESCGIPSLLKSNAAPSDHVFTVNGIGGVKIMIWESVSEKARELINGKNDV